MFTLMPTRSKSVTVTRRAATRRAATGGRVERRCAAHGRRGVRASGIRLGETGRSRATDNFAWVARVGSAATA
jgi:hypothetical protein